MTIEEEKAFNDFLIEIKEQLECMKNKPIYDPHNRYQWKHDNFNVKIKNPIIIKHKNATYAKVELYGKIKFVFTSEFFDRYSNNQELIGEYQLESNSSMCGTRYNLLPHDLNWRWK